MFSEEQIHRNMMEHFDHCAGGDRRLQLPQYFLSNSAFHSAHNSCYCLQPFYSSLLILFNQQLFTLLHQIPISCLKGQLGEVVQIKLPHLE